MQNGLIELKSLLPDTILEVSQCFLVIYGFLCILWTVLHQSCPAYSSTLDPTKRRDKAALSRYSAHSIRVRAANILHRQGMSDSYIQKRLRWKSTTFLNYCVPLSTQGTSKHGHGQPNSHIPDLHDRTGQPILRFRPLSERAA